MESGHVTFTAMMCDNVHGVSPTREAHLNYRVQSFCCVSCACLWMSQCTQPNFIIPLHLESPLVLKARTAGMICPQEDLEEGLIHSLEVGSEKFGQEIQTS